MFHSINWLVNDILTHTLLESSGELKRWLTIKWCKHCAQLRNRSTFIKEEDWCKLMGTSTFFWASSVEHQFICKVESMGSMLYFEHDTMCHIFLNALINVHRSHASINFDWSISYTYHLGDGLNCHFYWHKF